RTLPDWTAAPSRADDARTDGSSPGGSREGWGRMAVSEEILETRRGLGVLRPGRRVIAFVIAAALGIGLVVGGLYAWHDSLAGRILPGVSAAGIDLGGLTADGARAALESRYGALAEGGLIVRTSVGTTTIPYADVGRGADIEAMAADAASLGRGGS